MKRHVRRRRRRRSIHVLSRNRVITTWKDSLGRPTFRMGRSHGTWYIERWYRHFPGLAGLSVRRNVSRADAIAFTPDQWIDDY